MLFRFWHSILIFNFFYYNIIFIIYIWCIYYSIHHSKNHIIGYIYNNFIHNSI